VEAAALLGMTPDALRKKLQRGTIPGTKVDGEWRVARPAVAVKPDSDRPRPRPDRDGDRGYLDHLEAEIAYLREQLDVSQRERAAERERFDVIHREALQRIEALSPGEDAILSPRNGPGREETSETDDPPSVQPSWLSVAWRKVRG